MQTEKPTLISCNHHVLFIDHFVISLAFHPQTIVNETVNGIAFGDCHDERNTGSHVIKGSEAPSTSRMMLLFVRPKRRIKICETVTMTIQQRKEREDKRADADPSVVDRDLFHTRFVALVWTFVSYFFQGSKARTAIVAAKGESILFCTNIRRRSHSLPTLLYPPIPSIYPIQSNPIRHL